MKPVCVRKRRSAAEKSSSPKADESGAEWPSHFVTSCQRLHGRVLSQNLLQTWQAPGHYRYSAQTRAHRLPPAKHRRVIQRVRLPQMRRGGAQACRDATSQAGCTSRISNHSDSGRLIVPWESACRRSAAVRLAPTSRPVSLNVSAVARIPSPWECELMKTARFEAR